MARLPRYDCNVCRVVMIAVCDGLGFACTADLFKVLLPLLLIPANLVAFRRLPLTRVFTSGFEKKTVWPLKLLATAALHGFAFGFLVVAYSVLDVEGSTALFNGSGYIVAALLLLAVMLFVLRTDFNQLMYYDGISDNGTRNSPLASYSRGCLRLGYSGGTSRWHAALNGFGIRILAYCSARCRLGPAPRRSAARLMAACLCLCRRSLCLGRDEVQLHVRSWQGIRRSPRIMGGHAVARHGAHSRCRLSHDSADGSPPRLPRSLRSLLRCGVGAPCLRANNVRSMEEWSGYREGTAQSSGNRRHRESVARQGSIASRPRLTGSP